MITSGGAIAQVAVALPAYNIKNSCIITDNVVLCEYDYKEIEGEFSGQER